VLGLRWFRDRTGADALARDYGISGPPPTATSATSSRCWRPGHPDLRGALERASKDGFSHVILNGKIMVCAPPRLARDFFAG